MGPTFFLPLSTQDEREARETVKREQDEAYRLSLEADRKKVFFFVFRPGPSFSRFVVVVYKTVPLYDVIFGFKEWIQLWPKQ